MCLKYSIGLAFQKVRSLELGESHATLVSSPRVELNIHYSWNRTCAGVIDLMIALSHSEQRNHCNLLGTQVCFI